MKIYSVTSSNCCPTFKSVSDRRIDAGITRDIPTVKDLYDMEDRIQESQRKLIKKQNKLIAEVLKGQTLHLDNPESEVYTDALNLKLDDLYTKTI